MHSLSSTFVLGYHGCDRAVGERLLQNEAFEASNNDYDWLGPGIYFWEVNPARGLEFAGEVARRKPSVIRDPFVVGAIISLGRCLDLATSAGIERVRAAHETLVLSAEQPGFSLPRNGRDLLRRHLDCAVMRRVHLINERAKEDPYRYRQRSVHRGRTHLSRVWLFREDPHPDSRLQPRVHQRRFPSSEERTSNHRLRLRLNGSPARVSDGPTNKSEAPGTAVSSCGVSPAGRRGSLRRRTAPGRRGQRFMKKPTSNSSVMPIPPCIWTASCTARVALAPALAFATETIAPAVSNDWSSVCRAFNSAERVSSRSQ